MIKEVIYQGCNKITEKVFSNIISEQNENVLTQKVKELSESYILSIGAQTLIGSLALKACGISFGTSFPILLALVVAKSFISTLNCAKTAIKATLNGAKTVIQITAQKAASPFMRAANVINTIFQKVCASFTSFALSSYHLMRNTYPFRTFNGPLPITPPLVENEESIAEVLEQVTIEEQPTIAENKAPSKPRLLSCDSQFMIREKDSKEGYLLRGFPIDPTAPKEEIVSRLRFFKSALGNRPQSFPPMPMLFKDNALWMFFLENDPDRPLKESTSKRTAAAALKDVPNELFLEGIPVSLRSKF